MPFPKVKSHELTRQWRRAMTLQEAKSIARHLGLTLRKVRSGDYRVSHSCHNHVSRRGFCIISLPTDAGRDCTLRATCVQKTPCSDLSQIKYGRWSSALHGRWGVYWLPRSPNQGGRAMETGMGNALVIE
jgi:hypothetical protein